MFDMSIFLSNVCTVVVCGLLVLLGFVFTYKMMIVNSKSEQKKENDSKESDSDV